MPGSRDCLVEHGAGPSGGRMRRTAAADTAGRRPHLLIDDHLIEAGKDVARQGTKSRSTLAGPVVPATEGYRNCQPWCTVVREVPARRGARMWYNAHPGVEFPDNVYEGLYGTHFATLASDDGTASTLRLDQAPLTVDATVLDDVRSCATRRTLQVACCSKEDDEEAERPRKPRGLSPDGLRLNGGRRRFPGDTNDKHGRFSSTRFPSYPANDTACSSAPSRKTPYAGPPTAKAHVLECPAASSGWRPVPRLQDLAAPGGGPCTNPGTRA